MSRRGIWGVVVGASLLMAALLIASSGPSVDILSRPAVTGTESRLPTTTLAPTATPTTSSTTSPSEYGGFDPSGIIGSFLLALAVLLIVSLVVLLAAALLTLYRRTRPQLESEAEPSFAIPDVPEDLLRSADQGLAGLETGEPRNAIVAAWIGLEEAATASGLPRHRAETSSEYTSRVLGTWDVDDMSLQQLARLFREARFSSHELGEDERHRAIACLQQLQRDLRRAATTPAPGGEPT